MTRLLVISFAILGLAALSGCSSNTPGGAECDGNSDCNSGQICDQGSCVLLCSSDLECSAGEVCTDQVCRPGVRGQPTIDAVDGDGSNICPAANGTHCLENGLVVRGTNLLGAAFRLTPSGGTSLSLNLRDGATADRAELDLPDVPPGDYVLTAVNASGSADQALQLLQGPPGEAYSPTPNQLVSSINTATNTIAIERVPHDHDASAITSGVFEVARIPSHGHAFTDLTGAATIGQLPTGTSATTVAFGNHTHAADGFCYTHWGATTCATGFTAVLTGRSGGQESYTGSSGTFYSNVECVSGSATTLTTYSGTDYPTRMMRGDSGADGMSAVVPTCAICCKGGCYTAFGTNQCAADYTRVYEGRSGGIEAYEPGRPNGKTLCIDIAATARYIWPTDYDTRMMRHRTPTTSGSTDGMERIANSCAVCCQ